MAASPRPVTHSVDRTNRQLEAGVQGHHGYQKRRRFGSSRLNWTDGRAAVLSQAVVVLYARKRRGAKLSRRERGRLGSTHSSGFSMT